MMTHAIRIGGATAAATMAMAMAMLLSIAAGSARAQGELFNPARIAGAASDPAKIIDLTYSFDASTIYWPTEELLRGAGGHNRFLRSLAQLP